MSQSLCKISIHVVFHIKTTSPSIHNEHLEPLHKYLGEMVNATGCQVLRVGGVADHVHILCLLSKTETVAHLVEEVKRNSSRWIKTLDKRYRKFSWQGGYAAFSVSESVIPKTLDYVGNQREHHKKLTFHEEYLKFLELYKIEYDKKYVFTD